MQENQRKTTRGSIVSLVQSLYNLLNMLMRNGEYTTYTGNKIILSSTSVMDPFECWKKSASWFILTPILSLDPNLRQPFISDIHKDKKVLKRSDGLNCSLAHSFTSLANCCRTSMISEKLGLKVGSCCQHLSSNCASLGGVCFGIVGLKP